MQMLSAAVLLSVGIFALGLVAGAADVEADVRHTDSPVASLIAYEISIDEIMEIDETEWTEEIRMGAETSDQIKMDVINFWYVCSAVSVTVLVLATYGEQKRKWVSRRGGET